MTNQALRQALARAWIVLAALALAACGSVATASSASPGFTGYDWQVVAIGHAGKVTPIPARLEVALQFSPGGQFVAFDGISPLPPTYCYLKPDFLPIGMTWFEQERIAFDPRSAADEL